MAPFSGEALESIKRRSRGRSELTGRTDRPLHALHFNHDKSRKDYNKPNNGMRATITEHLAQHLYYRGYEQAIGLKPCTNDWAIQKLNEGTVAFLYKIGKLNEFERELAHSLDVWHGYASTHGLPTRSNYAILVKDIIPT